MGQAANYSKGLRRFACGLAALGVAAVLPLASSTAAPVSGTAARTIKFTFSDVGKGRWSTVGDTDKGSIAVNYSWKGAVKFRVPTGVLSNPSAAKFNLHSVSKLTGSWVGDLQGTQYGVPTAGPYHCSYKGTNIPITVDAQLTNGPKRGTMQLVLMSRGGVGFFPDKGNGASAECSTAIGDQGPTHFEPSWLFRDTYNDRGQLTYLQALIDLPTKLLPQGSTKIKFPKEVGNVDSPLRAKLAWNNVGTFTVKTS